MLNDIRIWFMDNIWTPLTYREKTPVIVMTGEELIAARQRFNLTSVAMAKILAVPVAIYRSYELNGLIAPHETQGSVYTLVKIMIYALDNIETSKRVLKDLGYKGLAGK